MLVQRPSKQKIFLLLLKIYKNIDTQIYKQLVRLIHTDRHTERQTKTTTYTWEEIQTERDTQTDGQRERQTDRHIDRNTDFIWGCNKILHPFCKINLPNLIEVIVFLIPIKKTLVDKCQIEVEY